MEVVTVQRHGGSGRDLALQHPAPNGFGPCQVLEQGHRPIRGMESAFHGEAFLKPGAGLRAEAHAAGRAAHPLGGKNGSFQPDGLGVSLHRRFRPAHHPCQGDGLIAIGHHQGFLAEGALLSIQRKEGFCWVGLAKPKRPRKGVSPTAFGKGLAIKGVEWLAGFEHHKIGDVDHVVDGTDTRPFQPALEPQRGGLHPHLLQGRHGEDPPLFHQCLIGGSHRQRLGRG